MSLINQMLRDLDKRHALDQDKGALPDTVRASGLAGASDNRGLAALKSHKSLLAFAGVAVLAYVGLQQMPDKTPVPIATPEAATALPPMPDISPAPAPIALQPAMALSESPVSATLPEEEIAIPPAELNSNTASRKPVAAPQLRSTASLGASMRVRVGPDVVTKIDRQPAEADAEARVQRQYREALVQMNKGQLREAMQSLYTNVRERPTHDASWQILVRLLLEQQRAGEAMQVLSEIVAARPGYLPVVMQLARLQAEYSSDVLALRTLLEHRSAASADADYIGFVATLAQRQKQYAQAASEFRQALALRPSEGRWWIGLGLAEEAQGRQAEAVAAWRRALSAGQIDSGLRQFAERKLSEG